MFSVCILLYIMNPWELNLKGDSRMFYTKDYLGDCTLGEHIIHYFIIKRDQLYGISIEEKTDIGCACETEYFTESEEIAYAIGQKMQTNGVSLVHMASVIDDFIQ